VTAFLVDVYDTLVSCDFQGRRVALADQLGADAARIEGLLAAQAPDIDRGLISVEDAYARAFADCGVELTPGLFEQYHSLHDLNARLFPDAIPFLSAARDQGIAIALVSNCAAGTREMLDELGVLGWVDAAVLSHEIGHAKPSPEIYRAALESLGVSAGESVFVDDQRRYCDGAAAVGLTAVQIARSATAPVDGYRVVGSLLDLVPG
jgi:HAD superfamily hydrolase (TIGR01509 family)